MFRAYLLINTIISLLLVTGNLFAEPIRLSEPFTVDKNNETFGQPLAATGKPVDLVSLVRQPDTYLGRETLIDTTVAKVCQKKGCFFIAQQDGYTLRVSFKDYGFFIPTDSGGKSVLLSGKLVKKDMTEEQVAHFKADLNSNSNALTAGEVYEIVASGIKIPRS